MASKPGDTGALAPPFLHKIAFVSIFYTCFAEGATKDHLPFFHSPETLKVMLSPTQISKIPNLILTLVTMTMPHRFHASVAIATSDTTEQYIYIKSV